MHHGNGFALIEQADAGFWVVAPQATESAVIGVLASLLIEPLQFRECARGERQAFFSSIVMSARPVSAFTSAWNATGVMSAKYAAQSVTLSPSS